MHLKIISSVYDAEIDAQIDKLKYIIKNFGSCLARGQLATDFTKYFCLAIK